MSQALFPHLMPSAELLYFHGVASGAASRTRQLLQPDLQGINRFTAPILAPTSRLLPDIGPVSLNVLVITLILQAVIAYGAAQRFTVCAEPTGHRLVSPLGVWHGA